jgi:hypothetical protein
LHFRGNRQHAWANETKAPARLLWTGTLPLFRARAEAPARGSARPKSAK